MIKVNVFGVFLIARILFLAGVCLLFGLVFINPEWTFTQIVLGIIILLSTIELTWYLNRTNRDMSKILETLKHEDYANSFTNQKSVGKYAELTQKMENIKQEYETKSSEREQNTRMYQKVLSKINWGILLIGEDGQALIQNEHFNRLLGLPEHSSLGDVKKEAPLLFDKIEASSEHGNFVLKNEELSLNLQSDLNLKIYKYKNEGVMNTMVILSPYGTESSGGTFETWVNFSKVISHEILNGISPLISLTSTLSDQVSRMEGNDAIKASMQKAIGIIEERTKSLQNYSERYRSLQQLPEPTKQPLKWKEVIEKNVQMLSDSFQAQNIQVSVEGDQLNEDFKADPWQMDQVFSNLLLNSIHALEEKQSESKSIQIDVRASRLYYQITISDNGTGIDKDNRANVFMPFFTTRESGSGIGLSVVKQILWKHNATIFLKDNDEGATFVIRFPKV